MFAHVFTSVRSTPPDRTTLVNTLVSLDASAIVVHDYLDPDSAWTVWKSTDWTTAQINTVQNTIDTSPASSPQLTAQSDIDAWPIELKALVLALIDQLNTIRAALPTPLSAITPAQALAAVRAKAGTL